MFRSLMAASALLLTSATAFADDDSAETSNMVCVEAGTNAPAGAALLFGATGTALIWVRPS